MIPVRHVYFIKHLHRRSADQKTKLSGQHNQCTCLFSYRNELVPPLHDTCGTYSQIRSGTNISIRCDYRDELIPE